MQQKILHLLKSKNEPLSAEQIAAALDCEKKDIYKILYSTPSLFRMIGSHRWVVHEAATQEKSEPREVSLPLPQAVQTGIISGRISEIYDFANDYYKVNPAQLSASDKLDCLCAAMRISPQDIDEIISSHSAVGRTIKGHAFEVVFDTMMQHNGIVVEEVGGDSDIDRTINGRTLQLKTQYAAGCSDSIVSYKTHKTHGAKSQEESFDYYHKVSDFADYLVGLVSYHPFRVMIIPKNDLPRVPGHEEYIMSPMYIDRHDPKYLNNFSQLGIDKELFFPEAFLKTETNELLSKSSKLLNLRSDYILRAIYIKDNFRIWDMNMRGFIREHVLTAGFAANSIHVYPPTITGKNRADKCDLVLKTCNDHFVRFQVKGLTWRGCTLNGINTKIDCETQLSRGRVNDHPTQSRLYMASDFEAVFIAVDPPYSNALSLAATEKPDYHWRFYCVPQEKLTKHATFQNRIASHQFIKYLDLQKYLVDRNWLSQWKRER